MWASQTKRYFLFLSCPVLWAEKFFFFKSFSLHFHSFTYGLTLSFFLFLFPPPSPFVSVLVFFYLTQKLINIYTVRIGRTDKHHLDQCPVLMRSTLSRMTTKISHEHIIFIYRYAHCTQIDQ